VREAEQDEERADDRDRGQGKETRANEGRRLGRGRSLLDDHVISTP